MYEEDLQKLETKMENTIKKESKKLRTNIQYELRKFFSNFVPSQDLKTSSTTFHDTFGVVLPLEKVIDGESKEFADIENHLANDKSKENIMVN